VQDSPGFHPLLVRKVTSVPLHCHSLYWQHELFSPIVTVLQPGTDPVFIAVRNAWIHIADTILGGIGKCYSKSHG
jgi:hypothetical protein